MACEHGLAWIAGALHLLAGCDLGEDATVVAIEGIGLADVTMIPSGETAGARADWDLETLPETSRVQLLRINGVRAVLEPDVRGIYVVDRWLRIGVSEELTHRFVVAVPGVAGLAVIDAPEQGSVGERIVADGAASSSPERRALTYQWRLARRPRDSGAGLDAERDAQTSFVADVPGEYAVALSVFDGELWSDEVNAIIAVVP
jgi:hypothetical protein